MFQHTLGKFGVHISMAPIVQHKYKNLNSQNPGSVFRDAASLQRFFLKCIQPTRKTVAEEKKKT
jgi:hypothetical protein